MAISSIQVGSTKHELEATRLVTPINIDGISFDGENDVVRYGLCSTAAGTAAKTALLTNNLFDDMSANLEVLHGAKVTIKFMYANTASSPTLKVGTDDARAIYWHGKALTSAQYWEAGAVLDLVCTGSVWEIVGVAKDNDTKVTSVTNHYTPTSDSAAAISVDASSTTSATWGSTDMVTGVNLQRDAKGHVTGLTVDSIQMPSDRLFTTLVPTGTKITSSADAQVDLNTTDYLKVGRYYCSQNAQAKTIKNCPTANAFMMEVYSPLSPIIDNETTATYVYRIRKLTDCRYGTTFIQYVSSSSTAGTFTYESWYACPQTKLTLDTTDSNGGSLAVGDANTGVYINSTGRFAACTASGVYYIEGNSTTAGAWTGSCTSIEKYEAGLMIAYKTNVAGISRGTTLQINRLGAVPVVRNATTAVTTTYAAGSILFLVYTVDSDGTAYWKMADYDDNTKTTTNTTNKTGAKLFLAGGTTQGSSVTTYSNKYCYVGKDNSLYSYNATAAAAEKVITTTDLTAAIGDAIAAAY